jgi:uncharacterized protein YbjT (DUF2867 family)
MILVAGGTGRLGSQVVRLLAARGEQVRVLARDPTRAASLGGPGVEALGGDVRDPAAVARAMKGITTVVAAMHGFAGKGVDTRTVDLVGNQNLIAAAQAEGVGHYVLLSVHGARSDHPMELFQMKARAEQALRASALQWTILRPTAFTETWAMVLGEPLLAKGRTMIFGRGNNPINFVSTHDVARFVDLAITDAALRGRCIDVPGPENLTFTEFVDTFRAITGVSGSAGHVPLPMMRLMSWVMRPFAPTIAGQIRAGVVMDTEDFAYDLSVRRFSGIPSTTVADAIRRDYFPAATLAPAASAKP